MPSPTRQTQRTFHTLLQLGLALDRTFLRALRRWFAHNWAWLFLGLVLLTLALFLLGNNLLGFDKQVATLLALAGTLVTTVVALLTATLIVPLIALIGAFVTALMGAVTVLITLLITPIIAFATGLFTSLLGWFATTWLGTLLSPIYYLLAPLVLKIAPWLSTANYSRLAWKRLHKYLPITKPKPRPRRAQPKRRKR